jgi:hypothetical protein
MNNILDTSGAAKYLKVTVKTLEKWRWEDRGPAFMRLSHKCVRYRIVDLEKWLTAVRVVPKGGRQRC